MPWPKENISRALIGGDTAWFPAGTGLPVTLGQVMHQTHGGHLQPFLHHPSQPLDKAGSTSELCQRQNHLPCPKGNEGTASSSRPGSQHLQCLSQTPCAPLPEICRLQPGHYPWSTGLPLPRQRLDHLAVGLHSSTLKPGSLLSLPPLLIPNLPSLVFAPLCILLSSDAHSLPCHLQHSTGPGHLSAGP